MRYYVRCHVCQAFLGNPLAAVARMNIGDGWCLHTAGVENERWGGDQVIMTKAKSVSVVNIPSCIFPDLTVGMSVNAYTSMPTLS